jgi:sulfur-carrier protein adenylyltransferase/sulfurtransferase
MNRKYFIPASLLIIVALGLALLPRTREPAEVDPVVLHSSIVEKSRYLSVDQVTHRIIENDPTILLIDLRPADQFSTFTLPGAIHLDPDSLLTGPVIELFSQPGKDKVLISNSDLTAEKVWLLCTRYSLKRIYIMKGGMNEWYNTIINLKEISTIPSSAELDLANFRKAARQFFIGSAETVQKQESTAVKQKVTLKRKAPKARSGGGC